MSKTRTVEVINSATHDNIYMEYDTLNKISYYIYEDKKTLFGTRKEVKYILTDLRLLSMMIFMHYDKDNSLLTYIRTDNKANKIWNDEGSMSRLLGNIIHFNLSYDYDKTIKLVNNLSNLNNNCSDNKIKAEIITYLFKNYVEFRNKKSHIERLKDDSMRLIKEGEERNNIIRELLKDNNT